MVKRRSYWSKKRRHPPEMDRHTGKQATWGQRQRLEQGRCKPRDAKVARIQEKLDEARKDGLLLGAFSGSLALDFGLL